MNVKWLIESDAFDEDSSNGIIEALKQQDVPYKILTTIEYFEDKYNHFPSDDCIFFYGSVQVAKAIQKKNIWQSGVIGDFSRYDCSGFYPGLGNNLLSSNYILTPFSDLQRLWPFYQQIFNTEYLFIRPNGGDKLFAGQVVQDVDNFFEKEYVYFSQFANKDSLCVIAEAFNIESEYRLMIANGEFVTGSCYRKNNSIHRSADVPDDVKDYANSIVKAGFNPDDAFILDVCQSNDNLFCLEINPIHSAGLYKIDPNVFVSTINNILMKRIQQE